MYLISIKIIQMLMQILVKKRATRILVLIIYGCFNKFRKIEALKTHRQNLKNNVSKSIVHVIKHANFQLYRVQSAGFI